MSFNSTLTTLNPQFSISLSIVSARSLLSTARWLFTSVNFMLPMTFLAVVWRALLSVSCNPPPHNRLLYILFVDLYLVIHDKLYLALRLSFVMISWDAILVIRSVMFLYLVVSIIGMTQLKPYVKKTVILAESFYYASPGGRDYPDAATKITTTAMIAIVIGLLMTVSFLHVAGYVGLSSRRSHVACARLRCGLWWMIVPASARCATRYRGVSGLPGGSARVVRPWGNALAREACKAGPQGRFT